ncbi:response regulator transcription factor [Microbulbifer sp. ARAS458-1]|uniref:response regulator transcription factor n=1 Tax=Microbulbifer sp. ARAS458-1 TaxID=3140242 RepID=UPI0038779A54
MLGAGLGAALLKTAEAESELPQVQKRQPVTVDAAEVEVASVEARVDTVVSGGGAPFSRRERQVLEQVAAGATSAEIAERLHISIHTVKNHRKSILRKAGCRNSGQLVSRCAALGLI